MDALAFTALLFLTRASFVEVLGAARAKQMRADAAAAFPALLAQVPADAPGGARPFYVATCYLAAIHRALPERPAADNVALVTTALRRLARWIPGPVIRARRWLWFQPWYNRRLAASILGPGEDSFAGDYTLQKDGFSVNYTRCGLQIFLARAGVKEIGPYVCGFDQLESEIFGLGLVRTGTIAQGAKLCDFRWTQSRHTQ